MPLIRYIFRVIDKVTNVNINTFYLGILQNNLL